FGLPGQRRAVPAHPADRGADAATGSVRLSAPEAVGPPAAASATPASVMPPASQNDVLYPATEGSAVPVIGSEASTAAATWLPTAPPTVRATVLTPFAVP